MYGLVFAGGGVRGAYQIGVWKALRELKIKVGAVTGTSIGAINAALFAQGSFETAYKLWRGATVNDIIALPEGTDTGENLFDIKNIVKLPSRLRQGGFDMSPLRELLLNVTDEKKLMKSPIDFGCAAYSVSGRSETRIFKNDIPRGKLVDYLMASASILGIKEIDGEKFTDGAVANNMPADMLIEKGYTDIITVNVRGAGIYKNISTVGCNIISIKYSEPMTGIMDFNRDGIEKSITEGYLDCMRAFGRLGGEKYYLRPDKKFTKYGPELISGLEKAAEAFGIDRLRAYTADELAISVMAEYEKLKNGGAQNREAAKIILRIAEALEKDGGDLFKGGLEILGANYDAASAVLYFKRKLR